MLSLALILNFLPAFSQIIKSELSCDPWNGISGGAKGPNAITRSKHYDCIANGPIDCPVGVDCNIYCEANIANVRRRRNLLTQTNQRNLLSVTTEGCAGITINCPANATCNVNCYYSCNGVTINAQTSTSLYITNCGQEDSGCNDMNIWCPQTNGVSSGNNCQIIGASPYASISGLNIYAQESFYEVYTESLTLINTPPNIMHCGGTATEKQCTISTSTDNNCESSTDKCDTFRISTSPTYSPSYNPSAAPSKSPAYNPSISPTYNPSLPSYNPSVSPTSSTNNPSYNPSASPTYNPSSNPSGSPTYIPSVSPTRNPSVSPTKSPTYNPSILPTSNPSSPPTTYNPTAATNNPSLPPSNNHIISTTSPTQYPSSQPTLNPSQYPTASPIIYISTGLSSTTDQINNGTKQLSPNGILDYILMVSIVVGFAFFITVACLLCIYFHFKHKKKTLIRMISEKTIDPKLMLKVQSISYPSNTVNTNNTTSASSVATTAPIDKFKKSISLCSSNDLKGTKEEKEEEESDSSSSSSASSSNSSDTDTTSTDDNTDDETKDTSIGDNGEGINLKTTDNTNETDFVMDYVNNGYLPTALPMTNNNNNNNVYYLSPEHQQPGNISGVNQSAVIGRNLSENNVNVHNNVNQIQLMQLGYQHRISDATHATESTIPAIPMN